MWLWTFFLDQLWYVIASGTAVIVTLLLFIGNIAALLASPLRVLTLSLNSGVTFAVKMLTTKGMRQALNIRVVTMDGKVGSVELWREASINRRDRMTQYNEKTKQLMQTTTNGPLGCNMLLEMTCDSDFYKARKTLEKGIRIFDQLEGEIVSRIHKLDDEQNAIREPANARINICQRALARVKMRHARAVRRSASLRNIWNLWPNIWDTNRKWLTVVTCKRRLKALRKDKKSKLRNIGKRYDRILKPHFARMHDFETEYLGHKIHEYQADYGSFLQTVISGRTLVFLLGKTDAAQAVRNQFRLEDLPHDKQEAQMFFVEQLRGRCGYHPYISIAELFEIWLRVHYHDMADDQLPVFELLDQTGFRMWLQTLPPPAGLGLAHAAYNHGPHLGHTTGWITPKPPEAIVHHIGDAAE